MKKNPKVSEEQKKYIIEEYEKGKNLTEIVDNLYEIYGLDLSRTWVSVIINEYCEKNNIQRKRNKCNNSRKVKLVSEMSKEEIKESLIQSLEEGRPCSIVYQIAQRYGINIDEELKKYGFFTKKNDKEIER